MPSTNKLLSGAAWILVSIMVATVLPVTEVPSAERILTICMFLNGISKLLND